MYMVFDMNKKQLQININIELRKLKKRLDRNKFSSEYVRREAQDRYVRLLNVLTELEACTEPLYLLRSD